MTAEKRKHNAQPEAMALDPEITRAVEATSAIASLDLEAMAIEDALALFRRTPDDAAPPASCEDRRIATDSGRHLRIRLYYPDDRHPALPVVMHLHGGGFVTGSIEMDDARCAALARKANCIVASVDYPLAPEHPFPEPVEDAFSAWNWLAETAAKIGGDPRRLAISGSSAGGHLAIGVCLLARERKAPMPLLQLLTYPVTDPSLASYSYRLFANGPFPTRALMAWFWKQYAGATQPDGHLWSPLTASLAGLPPAHVITAEYDVLRDDGEAYAARLRKAGIATTLHRYGGMIHGFLTVVPNHGKAIAALDESTAALSEIFAVADC